MGVQLIGLAMRGPSRVSDPKTGRIREIGDLLQVCDPTLVLLDMEGFGIAIVDRDAS